jgi:hypothetical protein
MSFFKKNILFSLLVIAEASIQSAHMLKDRSGNDRVIMTAQKQNEFEDIGYDELLADQLFVVIDKFNNARLAFFEQNPNGKYQVNFFVLKNPNISAEFSSKKEAQDFLYDFMMKQTEPISPEGARLFFARPPAKGGQSWRSTSSSSRRR